MQRHDTRMVDDNGMLCSDIEGVSTLVDGLLKPTRFHKHGLVCRLEIHYFNMSVSGIVAVDAIEDHCTPKVINRKCEHAIIAPLNRLLQLQS
jgi:hypothetical protein